MAISVTQGSFLGGVAQGREAEARRKLQERQLEQQQQRLDLLKGQMLAQSNSEARAKFLDELQKAQDYFVSAKQGFNGTSEEFFQQSGESLTRARALIHQTAERAGVPLAAQRFDMALRSTPTAMEAARQEGQLTVTGQTAQAEALQQQGFSPEQARAQAFEIEAADDFDFMAPDELAAAGFPPDSVVQVNRRTGEANVIREGGQGMPDRTEAVEIENKLRDELDKQSEDFEEQQRAFNSMQQLARDGTGASDVALVFSFFKSIDPQSTVREGEFATAANAMGLGEQLAQVFRRVDNGEVLSPELRKGLVEAARPAFVQSVTDQHQRQEFYRGLADRAGVDPTNVIRDRIRSEAAFVAMTDAELAVVDISKLTREQLRAYEAELARRGY